MAHQIMSARPSGGGRRLSTGKPDSNGYCPGATMGPAAIEILRGRLRETRYGHVEIGHGALGRHDEDEHCAATDFLDEERRVVRFEQDTMRRRVPELRRRGHGGTEDCRTHDREGFLGDRRGKLRGNDATIAVDHRDRLGARHVLEGAHHLRERRHDPPSRSKTHSRAPVLTHSTSARRTRRFAFASRSFDKIPRSRWHVSISAPAAASIEPRTRAPASVKRTSSAQPRSMIVRLPTSSGSSPRDKDRVISSARTMPSRKNRPWQAYDITLS